MRQRHIMEMHSGNYKEKQHPKETDFDIHSTILDYQNADTKEKLCLC